MIGEERDQFLFSTRCVQIESQISNPSRAIVGGKYAGKRKLPIWEKTRVKASATEPSPFACIQPL